MSAWEERLRESDWRAECIRNRCESGTIICPRCKHRAHQGVWVDPKSDNHVIVVAKHAHFVRPALIDAARNWYHYIRTERVDPRSFERNRVIQHPEYLPPDIRRIFDER
jgi:hypothetical protein